MTRHVPTSHVLDRLLDDAPADQVTLAWIIERLEHRSFGILMLVMAVVGLVPGASTVIGALLVFPAVQMIAAHRRPHIPRFLADRPISTARFAKLIGLVNPVLRRLEKVVHPRWRTPFRATQRLLGFLLLLLGLSMIWPFPFGHVFPALTIMLLGFAFLEGDGALFGVAVAVALVSFAITGASIWVAIEMTDLL